MLTNPELISIAYRLQIVEGKTVAKYETEVWNIAGRILISSRIDIMYRVDRNTTTGAAT